MGSTSLTAPAHSSTVLVHRVRACHTERWLLLVWWIMCEIGAADLCYFWNFSISAFFCLTLSCLLTGLCLSSSPFPPSSRFSYSSKSTLSLSLSLSLSLTCSVSLSPSLCLTHLSTHEGQSLFQLRELCSLSLDLSFSLPVDLSLTEAGGGAIG